VNPQLLVGGLAQGSIYALIALGFALYLRAMHLLNFSHGEVTMIGALAGVALYVLLGVPYVVALAAVIVISGVLGAALERGVFRHLWTRARDPYMINTVFATVAGGILLTNVGLKLGGPHPIRVPPPLGTDVVEVLGLRVVPHYAMVLGCGVLLVAMLQLFFQRTRAGLAMRAIMMDRETAGLMGVDVPRSISWTFAVSSALGGAAGFLLAPVIFWSFEMGTIGIKAFAGLTLGGLYSFTGAVVGGLLIGVLEALTGSFLSTAYRDVIVFGILILVLLFKPEGLFAAARSRR
jgi:branched-chain amino acid transport system permease protein